MTDADIADTISAFASAAADAKRLGFDTSSSQSELASCLSNAQ
jgi:hypothetical protein